jgi:hypothetical protein
MPTSRSETGNPRAPSTFARRTAITLLSQQHMPDLKPWILVDPIHKDPHTFKPIFMYPNGSTTTHPRDAKTFPSDDEAKQVSEGKPERWIPKPVRRYLPNTGSLSPKPFRRTEQR